VNNFYLDINAAAVAAAELRCMSLAHHLLS
jgi:hypothetical protein